MNHGLDLLFYDQIENAKVVCKFRGFKFIKSGLSYRISCEKSTCTSQIRFSIVHRGYGQYLPMEDIRLEKN